MTEYLLWAILFVVLVLAWMNMRMYCRVMRKEEEARQEEAIQAAMDEAAAEETRRSRAMDEGIENLMTFQVKAGGKMTGGEPW